MSDLRKIAAAFAALPLTGTADDPAVAVVTAQSPERGNDVTALHATLVRALGSRAKADLVQVYAALGASDWSIELDVPPRDSGAKSLIESIQLGLESLHSAAVLARCFPGEVQLTGFIAPARVSEVSDVSTWRDLCVVALRDHVASALRAEDFAKPVEDALARLVFALPSALADRDKILSALGRFHFHPEYPRPPRARNSGGRRGKLWQFVRRRSHAADVEVDQIAATIISRIYEKAHHYECAGHALGWIYAIARTGIPTVRGAPNIVRASISGFSPRVTFEWDGSSSTLLLEASPETRLIIDLAFESRTVRHVVHTPCAIDTRAHERSFEVFVSMGGRRARLGRLERARTSPVHTEVPLAEVEERPSLDGPAPDVEERVDRGRGRRLLDRIAHVFCRGIRSYDARGNLEWQRSLQLQVAWMLWWETNAYNTERLQLAGVDVKDETVRSWIRRDIERWRMFLLDALARRPGLVECDRIDAKVASIYFSTRNKVPIRKRETSLLHAYGIRAAGVEVRLPRFEIAARLLRYEGAVASALGQDDRPLEERPLRLSNEERKLLITAGEKVCCVDEAATSFARSLARGAELWSEWWSAPVHAPCGAAEIHDHLKHAWRARFAAFAEGELVYGSLGAAYYAGRESAAPGAPARVRHAAGVAAAVTHLGVVPLRSKDLERRLVAHWKSAVHRCGDDVFLLDEDELRLLGV